MLWSVAELEGSIGHVWGESGEESSRRIGALSTARPGKGDRRAAAR